MRARDRASVCQKRARLTAGADAPASGAAPEALRAPQSGRGATSAGREESTSSWQGSNIDGVGGGTPEVPAGGPPESPPQRPSRSFPVFPVPPVTASPGPDGWSGPPKWGLGLPSPHDAGFES